MFKHAPGLIVHDSSVNIIFHKAFSTSETTTLVHAQKQYEAIISHHDSMKSNLSECVVMLSDQF